MNTFRNKKLITVSVFIDSFGYRYKLNTKGNLVYVPTINKKEFLRTNRLLLRKQLFLNPGTSVENISSNLWRNALFTPVLFIDKWFMHRYKLEKYFSTFSQEWIFHEAIRGKLLSWKEKFNVKTDVKWECIDIEKLNRQLDYLFDLQDKKFNHFTCAKEVEEFIRKDTASGVPYFKKKGDVLDLYTEQTQGRCFITDLIESFSDPTVLDALENTIIQIGYRVQQRETKIKVRQMYIVPFQIIIIEILLFQNILKHFDKNPNTVYLKDDVFTDLQNRMAKMNRLNLPFNFTVDYKAMDQSMSQGIIEFIFAWLKDKIIFESEMWERIYDLVVHVHLHGYINTVNEHGPVIVKKKNGLFSGSLLTNFLGTVNTAINLQVFFNNDRALIENNVLLLKEMLMAKGDDSVLRCCGNFNLERFSKFVFDVFGMTVPVDELHKMVSSSTEEFYFLGAKMDINGRYPDPVRIQKQICAAEHFISTEVMSKFERRVSKVVSVSSKYIGMVPFIYEELTAIKDKHDIADFPKDFYLMSYVIGRDKVTWKGTFERLKIQELVGGDFWKRQ